MLYLVSIIRLLLPIVLVTMLCGATRSSQWIDVSNSVLVVPDDHRIVQTAQRVITEEVLKRTGLSLTTASTFDEARTPAFLLCRADNTPEPWREFVATMNVPNRPDGFAIAICDRGRHPVVVLAGHDERGVLFAAGRLLLQLKMARNQIEIPSNYAIATAPRYPHRGHQIAYRSLSHCYDAWTPAVYEQYMRELVVFGANAFEATPLSIDRRDGPHAKQASSDMAAAWSRISDDYGFSIWLFTEAVGGQGRSPDREQDAVEARLAALRAFPHLDHLCLAGGDGGTSHRRPDLMLERTSLLASEAREIHPGLGVWVSNQGFAPELNNWFFEYLQQREPSWVTGSGLRSVVADTVGRAASARPSSIFHPTLPRHWPLPARSVPTA